MKKNSIEFDFYSVFTNFNKKKTLSMVLKYFKLNCTQDLDCTQVEGNGNTVYAAYIIGILIAAFGFIANVVW